MNVPAHVPDKVDRAILAHLQRDGRIANVDLADAVRTVAVGLPAPGQGAGGRRDHRRLPRRGQPGQGRARPDRVRRAQGRPPLPRDLRPGRAGARSHPQRKAVEECPPGAVFVIDSRKDARAASAGSISHRAADETRRCRSGDRRRLPRLTGDRASRHSDLSSPSGGADQSHRASGARTSTCRSPAATRRSRPGDVIVGDGEGVVVIPLNSPMRSLKRHSK